MKSNGVVGYSPCGEFAEEGLVRHAQTGCLNCRNQLIERNADRLRSFVVRTVYPSPEIDDLYQQTICRALAKFHQFRGDSSFLTWLCSIALNEARQMMRKQRRVVLSSFDEELLDKAFPSEEFASSLELCCQREARTKMRRAVRQLHPSFRTVVQMRIFEGRSLKDTAKCLRLTLAATKSRYFRARNHLVSMGAITYSSPANYRKQK